MQIIPEQKIEKRLLCDIVMLQHRCLQTTQQLPKHETHRIKSLPFSDHIAHSRISLS